MTLSARIQAAISAIATVCLVAPLVLGSAMFVASSI